jgi:dihydropteroate synthase
MGIINVTPDSFFDGGKYNTSKELLKQVEKMLEDGAAILDIGGYSSRPGAAHIEEKEEINRVLWAIKLILQTFPDTLISTDTFRSTVGEAALDEGACMINDISGGDLDPLMFNFISKKNVPYVIMHMKGTPQTMNKQTEYQNLLKEILNHLLDKVKRLRERGVCDLIIDPGIGFSKTPDQNYELLKNLNYFEVLEVPILVGISRKSMFYNLLGTTPENSLNATTAAHMIALKNGASLLRVHDVKEASEAIKIFKLTE